MVITSTLYGCSQADNIRVIWCNMTLNKASNTVNGLFHGISLSANVAAGYAIIGGMIQ